MKYSPRFYFQCFIKCIFQQSNLRQYFMDKLRTLFVLLYWLRFLFIHRISHFVLKPIWLSCHNGKQRWHIERWYLHIKRFTWLFMKFTYTMICVENNTENKPDELSSYQRHWNIGWRQEIGTFPLQRSIAFNECTHSLFSYEILQLFALFVSFLLYLSRGVLKC